jgi:hypothetical protein
MPYGPGTYGSQVGRPEEQSPLKKAIAKRLPKQTKKDK